MGLPNKLTIVRLILSPLLFVVFFLPVWTHSLVVGSLVVMWLFFVVIETTDVLDGHLARKWDQISDVGKVLDPFADVVSRMTYFICFTGVGVMPIWVLAILIYRELAVTFMRLLQIRKGVAMAASIWGKLKAVTYAISGVAGFLVVSLDRLHWLPGVQQPLTVLTRGIFILAAIASVGSLLTYLSAILKSEKTPT